MNSYQRVIFLSGPLFGLICGDRAGRDSHPAQTVGAAALLWISAVIILVLPTAEHEYTYRYVIPAVPLVCMAAALAFRRRDGEVRPQPGTRQERTPGRGTPPVPAPRPAIRTLTPAVPAASPAIPAASPNPPEPGEASACRGRAGSSPARRYPFCGRGVAIMNDCFPNRRHKGGHLR